MLCTLLCNKQTSKPHSAHPYIYIMPTFQFPNSPKTLPKAPPYAIWPCHTPSFFHVAAKPTTQQSPPIIFLLEMVRHHAQPLYLLLNVFSQTHHTTFLTSISHTQLHNVIQPYIGILWTLGFIHKKLYLVSFGVTQYYRSTIAISSINNSKNKNVLKIRKL